MSRVLQGGEGQRGWGRVNRRLVLAGLNPARELVFVGARVNYPID